MPPRQERRPVEQVGGGKPVPPLRQSAGENDKARGGRTAEEKRGEPWPLSEVGLGSAEHDKSGLWQVGEWRGVAGPNCRAGPGAPQTQGVTLHEGGPAAGASWETQRLKGLGPAVLAMPDAWATR
ncbi:hypothetical protein NDU88_005011 [Pleurodeles waltl]|uniref:Uncharacterized protein n=1 Tax=Pleurodeles waltl TaxID=8319 RepID=A0AAV7LLG1_PLEWA|nr:hypothetical protein NDU88_005011 [Pleurodeles waltl]